MQLEQVSKIVIPSGGETRFATLTGIDSTNIHILTLSKVTVGGAGGVIDLHPTTGGSADTTSNVSIAWTKMNSAGSFQNFGNATQDIMRFTDGAQEAPHSCNSIMFLYNWYDSNRYSYFSQDTVYSHTTLSGFVQGGIKSETTSHDGVAINTNQTGGGGFQEDSTFVLYKVLN